MSCFALLATFLCAAMVLHATVTETTTKFRFPCGPLDCAEAACWNDKRDWPTLNHPVSEPFFPNARQGQRRQAVCHHSLHVAKTVLVQRTIHFPSVNFDRSWHEYENGFGTRGNHWLGLKHIHRLSKRGSQVATLVIQDQSRAWHNRTWNNISVDSAVKRYALYLGKPYELPDLMKSARGQSFYTPDQKNINGKQTCGLRFRSGWWFGKCNGSMLDLINLNGRFNTTDDTNIFVGPYSIRHAMLSMQPIHYNEVTYNCDKSCPNGGTCEMASDNATYFCSCPTTHTGWRCESPLPTIPTITNISLAMTQTTVGPPDTQADVFEPHHNNGGDYMFEMFVCILVCVLVLVVICCFGRRNVASTDTRIPRKNSSKEKLINKVLRKNSRRVSDDGACDSEMPPDRTHSADSITSRAKPPLFSKRRAHSEIQINSDVDSDDEPTRRNTSRDFLVKPLFSKSYSQTASSEFEDVPLLQKRSTHFEELSEEGETPVPLKKSTRFAAIVDHEKTTISKQAVLPRRIRAWQAIWPARFESWDSLRHSWVKRQT